MADTEESEDEPRNTAAELAAIRTHHVSVYVEILARSYEAPTVKSGGDPHAV
jgi:hypothetical protein